MRPHNYSELFNQIEQDIKVELPDKSRALISEFVGYRHIELRDQEQKEAK